MQLQATGTGRKSHKACERLRSHGLLAGALTLHLAYLRSVSWDAEVRTDESDSTIRFMRLLEKLWRDRPEQGNHLFCKRNLLFFGIRVMI
jgi:hypothetical protein